MKSLKVLYNLLYEQFQREGNFICHAIDDLLKEDTITVLEHTKLFTHFLKQYPTEDNYPEFYRSSNFSPNWMDGSLRYCSWFNAYDRPIRLKFLEAILLKLP